MDPILKALGNKARLAVVRELRRSPGLRHAELMARLGLEKPEAGQLTKLIAPLEAAGLVTRTGAEYEVVDSAALGRLLTAAAEVNLSAQRVLAERARRGVSDAERLADELRAEMNEAGQDS